MLIVVRLLVLLIASSCVGKRLPGALADSPGGSASNEQSLEDALKMGMQLKTGNDGHGSLRLPGALGTSPVPVDAHSPGGSASNEQRLNKGNDGHGSLPVAFIAKMIDEDDEFRFRFKRGVSMKKLVHYLNHGRREVSKNFDIANMHELSWDAELVSTARRLCAGEDVAFPGRAVVSFKDQGIQKTVDMNILGEITGGTIPEYLGDYEVYHPLQSKVGCVAMECKVKLSVEVDGICALGPYETFEKAHFKLGPAGSECGGRAENDGLCTSYYPSR